MKRFLFFAASAIALFASCQKTEVNYEGNPQEIAVFAVNKVATKAPVDGPTFDSDDQLRVSAYLAAEDDNNTANVGSYFENILFEYSSSTTTWVGGQYWPLSEATMNFVAVTQKVGNVSLETGKVSFISDAFVVTLDNNIPTTGAENYDQTDLMYAAARVTKPAASNTVSPVDMTFKHALAWVNFGFKSNLDGVIKVTSVDLYAGYNGTATITPANYSEVDNSTKPLSVAAAWTPAEKFSKKVPNADNDGACGELALTTTLTSYGKGLLVVPTTSDSTPYFIINYQIKQSDGWKNYSYKHPLTVTWEEGKKYTYNVNITLNEIEVAPSVTDWTEGATTTVPLG